MKELYKAVVSSGQLLVVVLPLVVHRKQWEAENNNNSLLCSGWQRQMVVDHNYNGAGSRAKNNERLLQNTIATAIYRLPTTNSSYKHKGAIATAIYRLPIAATIGSGWLWTIRLVVDNLSVKEEFIIKQPFGYGCRANESKIHSSRQSIDCRSYWLWWVLYPLSNESKIHSSW